MNILDTLIVQHPVRVKRGISDADVTISAIKKYVNSKDKAKGNKL